MKSRKEKPVSGNFHFTDPWWQVIMLRTKKVKFNVVEPKDSMALCYRLRDDDSVIKDGVVHMLLSQIDSSISSANPKEPAWFPEQKERFYQYLK